MRLLVLLVMLVLPTVALENGLGRLPPQAWRSWNAFHTSMNQSTIVAMIDELTVMRPHGGGAPVSLQQLGYNMIGIDEGWEGCGMGVDGTQHYANGTPAVNAKFPDLASLVAYGHSKGVQMGFYLNGCACGERTEKRINYEGDVNLTFQLGFDGVKIDSCGAQRNMTLYAELFNQTGRPILIENCHQGQNFPDGGDPGQMAPDWCPYNTFRTSGDIIQVWDRVIENLMSVTKFLTKQGAGAAPGSRPAEPPIYFPPPPPGSWTPTMPISRPGCWAYPDMLEVGRMEGTGQTSAAMSADESSSHFAAWSIVSAPLVLGFDLSNTSRMNSAWSTISNQRAINVSQSWEEDRVNPSGAAMKIWQAQTLPAVVAGCGAGCPSMCVDQNPKCAVWAGQNQCEENPGYMRAVCPASCPSSSQQTGWKLTKSGQVVTPSGDCLDSAGQLPAADAGLNWLRTATCESGSVTQQWAYENNMLKSHDGRCLGVESHWLWPQPMVSVIGCGGSKTNLTLHSNGTLSSATNFGCFGVSDSQGPPSTLWRKPLPLGQTAVLAINGAALPHNITIDVASMVAPDGLSATDAVATDVWSGQSLGKVTHVSRLVPPHGNIFLVLG